MFKFNQPEKFDSKSYEFGYDSATAVIITMLRAVPEGFMSFDEFAERLEQALIAEQEGDDDE